MKTLALTFLCAIFLSTPLMSQEKKKSPAKTTESKVGDVNVKIEYSSPSVRGRTVFGDLEKWGKVWRAGANEATTMEFSQDVMINGEELPAGKYAFFVIPKENDDWTLIFNKEPKQWGAYKYDKSLDALRIDVGPEEIDPQEELVYRINDEGMVMLDWSTTRVSFEVK